MLLYHCSLPTFQLLLIITALHISCGCSEDSGRMPVAESIDTVLDS